MLGVLALGTLSCVLNVGEYGECEVDWVWFLW